MPTVMFRTLGCKLNQAETAVLQEHFMNRGYEVLPWGERADVTVLNTCTVTSRSDSKCKQAVGHILKMHPDTTVIVVGCYPQVAPDAVENLPGVDYAFGTYDKFRLFDHFPGPGKRSYPVVVVSPAKECGTGWSDSAATAIDRTRAFLKIQTGCSRACAYCIVPLARGPGRSLPMDDILRQARAFVQKGYREIVLTGTHIGDYGRDGDGRSHLPDLIQNVLAIEGCGRVRLSSLDPGDLGGPLLDCIALHPNVCRHLHLSLQSGSDAVLKAMNRSYTASFFREAVKTAVSRIGTLGLGADVIVGFPGETDAQFEETVQFIESLPFSNLHVFPFSLRRGTKAQGINDPVSAKIKTLRTERLRKLGLRKKRIFYRSWAGRNVEVLFEGKGQNNRMAGWSSEYVRVEAPFDGRRIRQIVTVAVKGAGESCVYGEIAEGHVG